MIRLIAKKKEGKGREKKENPKENRGIYNKFG
jgi:hypothetical protein